jgi:ribulose kinase
MHRYVIGLDFGTNSCRSLLADMKDGSEVAGHDYSYPSGNSSVILERVAEMAYHTLQLNSATPSLPSHILEKHNERKHGPNAYYGQPK